MKILNEFKNFAVKGNVVDMAVGIIIGGAFGKIVSSLVSDILMPPFSVIMGGVNFSNLNLILKNASDNKTAISLNYGLFLENVINFLIIAFSIFIFIKLINSLKKKEEETRSQKLSETEKLLTEIRNILENKSAEKK